MSFERRLYLRSAMPETRQLASTVSYTRHLGDHLKQTHISKLHYPDLPKSTDNLPADLICDVELGQAHVRRAEHRVLRRRHRGTARPPG